MCTMQAGDLLALPTAGCSLSFQVPFADGSYGVELSGSPVEVKTCSTLAQVPSCCPDC